MTERPVLPSSIEGGFVLDQTCALDSRPVTGRYVVAWEDTRGQRHYRALAAWADGTTHARSIAWFRRLIEQDMTKHPPV